MERAEADDDQDPGTERSWLRALLAWFPLALVIAVGAVFVTVLGPGEDDPVAGSLDPSATSSPGLAVSPTPGSPSATEAGPVVVDDAGESLFGLTAGWEVFARDGNEVVRIELASGRITHTTLPTLNSSGPVSFLVGPTYTIIQPLDNVDGYLLPDGEPARTLPPELNSGGPIFPGPPGALWVFDEQGRKATLRGIDGTTTGRSVRVPEASWPLGSDGRGNFVLEALGGVYLARPGELDRITTGAVIAIGATHFLVRECDDQARCFSIVINRENDTRRLLAGKAGSDYPGLGAISPDGSTAAVPQPQAGGLRLIDLSTGATDTLNVVLAPGPRGYAGHIAWSPDSEWLFVVGGSSGVLAVDADTHEVRTLDVGLTVKQVAVRPASD